MAHAIQGVQREFSIAPASRNPVRGTWDDGRRLANAERKMLPFWQHFQSRSALVCVGEHPFGYESVLTRIPELPQGMEGAFGSVYAPHGDPSPRCGRTSTRHRPRRALKNCSGSHAWTTARNHSPLFERSSVFRNSVPRRAFPVIDWFPPPSVTEKFARATVSCRPRSPSRMNAVGGVNHDGAGCVVATRVHCVGKDRLHPIIESFTSTTGHVCGPVWAGRDH